MQAAYVYHSYKVLARPFFHCLLLPPDLQVYLSWVNIDRLQPPERAYSISRLFLYRVGCWILPLDAIARARLVPGKALLGIVSAA